MGQGSGAKRRGPNGGMTHVSKLIGPRRSNATGATIAPHARLNSDCDVQRNALLTRRIRILSFLPAALRRTVRSARRALRRAFKPIARAWPQFSDRAAKVSAPQSAAPLAPAVSKTRVAICNNMVTPYTNRLFNHIVGIASFDLSVVSCTARESNRNWQERYAGCYNHTILRGVEFALPNSRSAHFNFGMWRSLRGLSPDLVAINGVYPTMLVAALWSYVHRKPLVFLTDGWRILMPQSFYHRVVRPLVVNCSAAVICSSDKGRQYFLEEGVEPQRIFVASIVPLWDGPRERLDFDQRSYDVLWCGRIGVSWKNWPFLLLSRWSCISGFRESGFRIVGDSRSPPETLARLSAAGINFEYTAYVPPEEIASVFAAARLLAVPSQHEAWGLVCNEAMQCGTPCAVSPLTGAAGELVVDGISGFVLDLDVNWWADTISTVLADRTAGAPSPTPPWPRLRATALSDPRANTLKD